MARVTNEDLASIVDEIWLMLEEERAATAALQADLAAIKRDLAFHLKTTDRLLRERDTLFKAYGYMAYERAGLPIKDEPFAQSDLDRYMREFKPRVS